ncbi:MAG: sigma-70 family RNA polymerase sigma factor [Ilumatobacteraceae bacterium]
MNNEGDPVDLVDLADVIRRALRSRTSDTHLVEDVTQEAMLRVAMAQHRLDPAVLRAYAIVTARNILVGHARKEAVARRHAHRVVDYTSLDGGEELTLEREETNALAHALDGLDEVDRQLLLDHEVDNISVAGLAARDCTTPGAIAMRLSRARSALRVEFLLTFRRVELPTSRCHPVLLAVSAGDRRRQVELGASRHLSDCATCAALSEPLVTRRRGAAARWALPVPLWMRRFGHRLRTSRVTQATAAILVAGVAVVVVALVGPGRHVQSSRAAAAPPAMTTVAAPPTATSPVPTSSIAAASTSPVAPSASTAAEPPATAASPDCPPVETEMPADPEPGCGYTLTGMRVVEVPADEGLWIQYTDGAPMWVHLVGAGESPERIRTGAIVTIRATVSTVAPDANSGIPMAQAARLAQRPLYLSVEFADLTTAAG